MFSSEKQGKTLSFDGLAYTRNGLAQELYEIQLHSSDGSAVKAHCSCIQEKHLLGVSGLAGEGMTLAQDKKEKSFYQDLVFWGNKTREYILKNVHSWTFEQEAKFYADLADAARELRVTIQQDKFEFPVNPLGKMFLSHDVKLQDCIKQVEIRCCGKHTRNYQNCSCNPIAVCRATIQK